MLLTDKSSFLHPVSQLMKAKYFLYSHEALVTFLNSASHQVIYGALHLLLYLLLIKFSLH